jgi:uncharacterized protein (DUF2141 family)
MLIAMTTTPPIKRRFDRRRIPRLPIQPLLLACLLAGQAQAADGKLVVQLQGIQPGEGQLRASLYQEPETFRKEARALQRVSIPAQAGSAELRFDGVPPGRYAVMVYHDSNDNQQLDLRFGMFPSEGYGLSNNPKVMGPPKFDDSAFTTAGGETRIAIQLSY